MDCAVYRDSSAFHPKISSVIQYIRRFYGIPDISTVFAHGFGDPAHTRFIHFSYAPSPVFGHFDELLGVLHKKKIAFRAVHGIHHANGITGIAAAMGYKNARISGEAPRTRAKRSFHSEVRKIYDNAAMPQRYVRHSVFGDRETLWENSDFLLFLH